MKQRLVKQLGFPYYLGTSVDDGGVWHRIVVHYNRDHTPACDWTKRNPPWSDVHQERSHPTCMVCLAMES